MRALGIAIVCLTGCYTGSRATRDINASWQGHASAELEARWGPPATRTAGELIYRRVDQHVELPSASGSVELDPTGFDIRFEARPGVVTTSHTDVVVKLDPLGNVAQVAGASMYLGLQAPRGANLRWGTIFGFHAGMGAVAGAETPLPSLGLYLGGMLGPRLGLVGAFSFANGNDPEGYGFGMSWALAPQYWPMGRLWVRAGPALVVHKDPVDGGAIDVGVATGASFALIRGRVFVLDLRLDATVATGAAFGTAGLGVNVN